MPGALQSRLQADLAARFRAGCDAPIGLAEALSTARLFLACGGRLCIRTTPSRFTCRTASAAMFGLSGQNPAAGPQRDQDRGGRHNRQHERRARGIPCRQAACPTQGAGRTPPNADEARRGRPAASPGPVTTNSAELAIPPCGSLGMQLLLRASRGGGLSGALS
jgi:hypothetical protein